MRDLWRGGLSYRRLDVLLRNLPEDSRTQTILRDQPRPVESASDAPAKFGPWSLGDYLTAHLIDAVNRNTYAVAVAGHLKDPKPSEPFPRPGIQPVRRISDSAEAKAARRYLDEFNRAVVAA